MSGIYIPGMKMSKFGRYEATIIILDESTAEIAISPEENDIGYWKEYPIIPVPEHGDLIDRDKLENDIERYIGGEESRSRFHHWVQVQHALIPEDKEEARAGVKDEFDAHKTPVGMRLDAGIFD